MADPSGSSIATSEALYGESVQLLNRLEEWVQIKQDRDGYEGFVEAKFVTNPVANTTHWVANRATLVFDSADLKSPVHRRLLFGSEVSIKLNGEHDSELAIESNGRPDKFSALVEGGFVWTAHLKPIIVRLPDSMISIAEANYLNAPYLWGGRSTDGCDCSGLVQMLGYAKGLYLPRDSGDQEASLNLDIEFNSRNNEDLVYWPGHVGVLKTPELLFHSTAHSLCCCIEPLKQVIQRAGQPSSIKRLSFTA